MTATETQRTRRKKKRSLAGASGQRTCPWRGYAQIVPEFPHCVKTLRAKRRNAWIQHANACARGFKSSFGLKGWTLDCRLDAPRCTQHLLKAGHYLTRVGTCAACISANPGSMDEHRRHAVFLGKPDASAGKGRAVIPTEQNRC